MRVFPLVLLLAVAACKPPPTDGATTGRMFDGQPDAPPAPLDSPDSEDGFWANSEQSGRIIYGQAGKAPLMALQCEGEGQDAKLRITRLSPADKGAQAFFALVGNSHVARIAVDAAETTGGFVWQGKIAANDPDLATLTGPREVTATLPGAGLVTLYPSERLKQVIADCRARTLPQPSIGILEDDRSPDTAEGTSSETP